MANRVQRSELVYLEDMLASIEKITAYIEGVTEEAFKEHSEKQDAVIRRIEIIGEAVKNLSPETRKKYPTVPWRAVAGMRDVVIHQYFGVTMGMVWRVATTELPALKEEIERIKTEMEQGL